MLNVLIFICKDTITRWNYIELAIIYGENLTIMYLLILHYPPDILIADEKPPLSCGPN